MDGGDGVGTEMKVLQVEGPLEKAPEKEDLVSYRNAKFSMSGVTCPEHLQFEEFFLVW